MPFPPLPEQRAIAAVLSKIQAAIEVQQKIVATLKELKAATMGKLFREGTRGERLKVTEIGEMPESWEVVKLETVARISTGTTPATDDPSNYDGDIPFIKTAEIDNNILSTGRQCISREAMKRYSLKLYPSQTVFLAMYGQGKTRGRVSLLGISATTTQNTAAIESGDDLDSLYLWHYLLGQYERLRNTGNLGHLSHLNLGYVKSLEIPLPSKNEQGQLGSVLSSLHSKIEVEEQKAGRLQTLFSSMLNLLMTGQVRVNGLNLEDVSQ
jgi:type I restriction enzyme S subunit